jgi:hypothetical protein
MKTYMMNSHKIKHLKSRSKKELTKNGYYEKITDLSKIRNIKFEDIDYNDSPDFCDAFISYAEYNNRELREEELDELNDNRDFVYEKLMNYLY